MRGSSAIAGPLVIVHVCVTETQTHFDVLFRRRSVTDYIVVALRRPSVVIQSLTACLWLRTDDLDNYGTVWSYAVHTNWLSADAASNAFTAYDYASLKVNWKVAYCRAVNPLTPTVALWVQLRSILYQTGLSRHL